MRHVFGISETSGAGYTVSISGLDPDTPQPQPWQSKIVAGNKVHRLYSQRLFYSARAGAGGCLDQDQISILYILLQNIKNISKNI